jgi:hypothetical protein
MNLLIAFMSDTYERVYDQRERASYAELVKLILELETLMFWNRKNTQKLHLVYAKEVAEEDHDNDITVGIGQKVKSVGNRIKAKIESVQKINDKKLESLSKEQDSLSKGQESLVNDVKTVQDSIQET